ncbi:GntR family transcriptional regulator [Pseudorhodoferax sp. Leaf274]|uniref:GntR family transcriptional regulator n=1 Tax=Pseudorhodoferax sp. Leaf274 TaxID=1736318 RepID=UPI0009E9C36C|nr:GntR family transcriptional regulator [Pseudorhodoferax sp. Leaf274]
MPGMRAAAPEAATPLQRLVAEQRAALGGRFSTDDIVAVLHQAIVRGIFHPGQALRQDELAAEFQVSKIPLREALRTLQAQGFVELPLNRGALVQAPTLDQLKDAFELRLLVEPSLMRTAAPLLTRADLDEAERLVRGMDKAGTAWAFSELNVRFHDLLYGPAQRPLSKQILAMLQGHIQRMSFMQLSLAGFNRSSNEDHRVILAACRQGDADAAARAVAGHVKGVRRIVLGLVAQQGGLG